MNRRFAIKTLGSLAALSLFEGRSLASDLRKEKNIGVQLYTLRNEMSRDAGDTIRKVAGLGYREVESFGYTNGKFFGMDPKTYGSLLKENALSAPSGHYMLPQLNSGWEKAIDDAAAIGQEYMVLAFLFPHERKTLDDYRKVADLLNKCGETCKKAGIQLCYHNHDFEFETIEGQIPFDILMQKTDKELVKAELDLYWAVKAGRKPTDIFRQYNGRIALWHVKDMDNTENKSFTEVGSGVIDFMEIFKQHRKSGMKHFFVEQDVCPGPPLQSIEKSIGHIKSRLLKYIS
jgi:sugar phosphate isomerase/epimerase